MNNHKIFKSLLHYFNLEAETDNFDVIKKTIEKDIVFKGTNLWILIFAILIASVGLNMNSTAVIIGAMLISPLMGPINGIGFSIATYNFPLLKKGLKNFYFAVSASLLTSTIYFALSPISTAHSELLARTSPTIYDVLIAFFGGFAGILAIYSKQKGNVIPGVAIATALMPPLCTAGYALATGQFVFFLGAFFLFTINSVFIALAALIVSQLLKFPIHNPVDEEHKKKINKLITIIIVSIIVPSIYLGYKLVQKENFFINANRFIKNVSIVEGNYLLNSELDFGNNKIKLIYGGPKLNSETKKIIEEKTILFNLYKTQVDFYQGFETNNDNSSKNIDYAKYKVEIEKLYKTISQKTNTIDSLTNLKDIGKQILNEISNLYPEIIACSYSNSTLFFNNFSNMDNCDIVILATSNSRIDETDKLKIYNWLKIRLKSKSIKVFYDNH